MFTNDRHSTIEERFKELEVKVDALWMIIHNNWNLEGVGSGHKFECRWVYGPSGPCEKFKSYEEALEPVLQIVRENQSEKD